MVFRKAALDQFNAYRYHSLHTVGGDRGAMGALLHHLLSIHLDLIPCKVLRIRSRGRHRTFSMQRWRTQTRQIKLTRNDSVQIDTTIWYNWERCELLKWFQNWFLSSLLFKRSNCYQNRIELILSLSLFAICCDKGKLIAACWSHMTYIWVNLSSIWLVAWRHEAVTWRNADLHFTCYVVLCTLLFSPHRYLDLRTLLIPF